MFSSRRKLKVVMGICVVLGLVFSIMEAGIASRPIKIMVMQGESAIRWIKQFDDFTGRRFEEVNNIEVEYALWDDPNAVAKVTAIMMAKDPTVTVLRLKYSQLPLYAEVGWCLPLDGKFPEKYTGDLVQWDVYAWDGTHYGVPWVTDTTMLIWNKTAFKEAGLDPDKPPRTWDELYKYAKKLTKKDAAGNTVVAGFGLWGELGSYSDLICAYGGEMMDKNGAPAFNGPAGIKAFDYLTKMVKEGILYPDTPFYNIHSGFLEGAVSLVHQYPYFWSLAATKFGIENIGVSLIPKGPAGRKNSLTGGAYFINPFAPPEAQEAALKWIQFFNSPEFISFVYSIGEGLGTPFRSQLESPREWVFHADWKVMYQAFKEGFSIDPPEIYKPALNDAFLAITSGKMTVKEALDVAVGRLERDPSYLKLDIFRRTKPLISE